MDTLILNRAQVATLLTIEECISAVEEAFRRRALGNVSTPAILGVHATDGGFHIKAGIMSGTTSKNLARNYFVAKINANFPQNRTRNGLPTIQGVIVISDAENGRLLAVMDSIAITIIRTGAATAVAANFLARRDATVATICGCGNQGRISLEAIMKVRDLKTVYAYDTDLLLSKEFAREQGHASGISVIASADLSEVIGESHICVTCTPSKKYFLKKEYVMPGTFIAAVGADSENKQEVDPALLASSKLVVDSIEQCAGIGELHHAIEQGMMTRDKVHAELGEIIAGKKEGRISGEEVITFDSTGTALQDVAAAAIVFEKAIQMGVAMKLNFSE